VNAEATRIYTLNNSLVLRNLMALYKVDRPDLKFKAFTPVIPQQFGSDAPLQGDGFSPPSAKKISWCTSPTNRLRP
jgi:polyphosphate kinase